MSFSQKKKRVLNLKLYVLLGTRSRTVQPSPPLCSTTRPGYGSYTFVAYPSLPAAWGKLPNLPCIIVHLRCPCRTTRQTTHRCRDHPARGRLGARRRQAQAISGQSAQSHFLRRTTRPGIRAGSPLGEAALYESRFEDCPHHGPTALGRSLPLHLMSCAHEHSMPPDLRVV